IVKGIQKSVHMNKLYNYDNSHSMFFIYGDHVLNINNASKIDISPDKSNVELLVGALETAYELNQTNVYIYVDFTLDDIRALVDNCDYHESLKVYITVKDASVKNQFIIESFN